MPASRPASSTAASATTGSGPALATYQAFLLAVTLVTGGVAVTQGGRAGARADTWKRTSLHGC
jgi:hypothetical protein